MYESTNVMLNVLVGENGVVMPMSTMIDGNGKAKKLSGFGGGVMSAALCLLALVLIPMLG